MEGSVVLPDHLVEKVKKKIEGTHFTIESYIAQLVEHSFKVEEIDDEQKVKERLKSLGYLD